MPKQNSLIIVFQDCQNPVWRGVRLIWCETSLRSGKILPFPSCTGVERCLRVFAAHCSGMNEVRVVRLRFVDYHSARPCLEESKAEARIHLVYVHSLAPGHNRELEAAASRTVF